MDFIVVTKWEYPNLGDDNRICRNFSYYQTNKINKISHDSLIQKAFDIFNLLTHLLVHLESVMYIIGKVNL